MDIYQYHMERGPQQENIVAADNSVAYDGIEQVHGRHFQHVANVALQQDLLSDLVEDRSVHPATRAHFRAAAQLGAGAVFTIDAVMQGRLRIAVPLEPKY